MYGTGIGVARARWPCIRQSPGTLSPAAQVRHAGTVFGETSGRFSSYVFVRFEYLSAFPALWTVLESYFSVLHEIVLACCVFQLRMRVIETPMEKMATFTTRHHKPGYISALQSGLFHTGQRAAVLGSVRITLTPKYAKERFRGPALLIPNPHVVPTAEPPPRPPFLLPHLHARSFMEAAAAATRTLISEETDPSSSCLVAGL